MPWIIGIDEAGYGPNLGPFVMTSAACRVPEELADANLWRVLRRAVRRHLSDADGRLLVADSKIVYSPSRGLRDLELGALAVLAPDPEAEGMCLAHCIERLCPANHAELSAEPWYTGTSVLPLVAEWTELGAARALLERTCRAKSVLCGPVRSVVVCPARFNQVAVEWGSKGAVLALGLAELVRANLPLDNEAEPVFFWVDKHGGRNSYTAIIQHALPEGFVMAHEEGMERSTYSILGLGRNIRLAFEPRADQQHFCVALASMVSKYLRELLMLEFNRFWEQHVPGLRPTAGYPTDSARFLDAIRPAMLRLQIAEPLVWRHK
jgi:ribonuclease HII